MYKKFGPPSVVAKIKASVSEDGGLVYKTAHSIHEAALLARQVY